MGFADNHEHDALLLVGHGSTVNEDSSAPVRRLVEALQRRQWFGSVTAAFWKEAPLLSTALEDIRNPRVFVVPFFVSQGYFTEELIPQVLGFKPEGQESFGRVRRSGEQTLFYCEPVGTHVRMTEVILSRARSVVDRYPFPEKPMEAQISLFIAGHGTGRNRNSRQSAENQADLIRSQADYASVHVVFMEEAPQIADWHKLAVTRHVVVVPFFLSDGLHAAEDIPVLLGEPEPIVRKRLANGQPAWQNPTETQGKLVWYASAVGTDPAVIEVIQDRVNEAAQWVIQGV